MFLPISKRDMKARGWDQCDFVYVIVPCMTAAFTEVSELDETQRGAGGFGSTGT